MIQNQKITIIFLFLLLFTSLALSDNYQFNTCGEDGRTGPNSGCYSGDNSVNILGDGVQEWEIPSSGIYEIEAAGAEGDSNGGLGAISTGEFELDEGETLEILVGQEGGDNGGGGGTFVVQNGEPMVVAGGGGGGGSNSGGQDGSDASSGTEDSSGNVDGGTNRDGGDVQAGSGYAGTPYSGAGFEGDGDTLDGSYYDHPSRRWPLGGTGSDEGRSSGEGGFGGGGGGFGGGWGTGGGGGGGYSGGAAGYRSSSSQHGGGGGGSYSDGSNPSITSGLNAGSGFVEIELLTSPDDPIIQHPEVESEHGDSSNPSIIEFEFEVDIDDDGGQASDNELEECNVEVEGLDSGNAESFSGDITSSGSGGGKATCEFEVTDEDFDQGEQIEVTVDVEDSYGGTDQWGPESENPSTGEEFVLPFREPSISDLDFQNFTDRHAFNVTSEVEFERDLNDVDDEAFWGFESEDGVEENFQHDEIDQHRWTEEDSSNNRIEYTVRVEPEACLSENCNGFFPEDFGVLEEVDVEFDVEDGGVEAESEDGTNIIPNNPPNPGTDPLNPVDGGLVLGEDAELNVSVDDAEDDPVNITFMDMDSDSELESYTDIELGEPISYTWESLDLGDHEWGVNVSDHYDYQVNSWTFTTVISDSFRLEQQVRYEYSSLILTETGTGNAFIDITNPHPDDKEINVELESQDGFFTPTFSENDGDEITVDLSQGETRTLQVSVTADDVTETENDKLIITSTDTNVGSVDVAELDVLVRSSEVEQRGVPGLTSIYLLFIGLAASVLFGLSVW